MGGEVHGHPVGDRAAIERIRPVGRERLEGPCQLRLPQALPDLEQPTAAQVLPGAVLGRSQPVREADTPWPVPLGRPCAEHAGIHRHAVVRVADRRSDEVRPGQSSPKVAMQFREPGDCRGHADRGVADVVEVAAQDRQISVVGGGDHEVPPHPRARQAPGARREVDDRQRAVRGTNRGHAPAPDPAFRRVDDALHEGRNERGFDGVGSGPQGAVGLVDRERVSGCHGVTHAWHPTGDGPPRPGPAVGKRRARGDGSAASPRWSLVLAGRGRLRPTRPGTRWR